MFPHVLVLLLFIEAQSQPSAFDTLAKQAAAARDGKRLVDALGFYKKALALKPDWEEGLWDYGSIAYDTDHFAECAPAFRKLTNRKPDLAPAWTMEGLCEFALHDYDAALKSLRRTEALGFREPAELARAARLHLALVLTKAGHYEKALVVLTDLTRSDQKTPEISVAAGIAGLRKPWLPVEVPETDRELVWSLGEAMSSAMERDPKGAVEKFQAVIHDHPNEANIHFRFGAFLTLDSPEKGLVEIKKALDLDPDNIPALVSLAMVNIKQGTPQAGKDYAEHAVRISPGDFATHLALGRVLLETEAPQEAAPELEVAVKLAPESPEAHFSLASAYGKLGRQADAARERAEFMRLRKQIDSATQP
jgi:tetratricopeptide (TPR) repeat protein